MKLRVLASHRARRIFLFVHLWFGLILGAWFSLIGISGSVLAWRGELSAMEVARRFPIQKPADAKMISISQAVAAMKKSHPDASTRELSTVTIPNAKMPFYAFSRGRDRATQQTILVDPYSAKVNPPIRMRTLTVGTIQQFHQRLIAGAKGYVANGVLTFLAIPLLISGLWLWWPTKLKHLRAHLVVKRGVSFKRTVNDLHNVMGIYLYPLLLLTTVTGAMLVQQHISADGGVAKFLAEEDAPRGERTSQPNREGASTRGREAGREGARPGGREGRREPQIPKIVSSGGAKMSEDALVDAARGLRPNLELSRVQFSQKSDEATQLTFARRSGFNLNETVLLNPYDGREVAAPAREESNASPLRAWTKTLHLGEFGGVFSKLLYTLAGLMPLGLFITGVLIWWRKKRAKMRAAR